MNADDNTMHELLQARAEVTRLKAELARITQPKYAPEQSDMFSAVYREGPITAEIYDEVIAEMQAAKVALVEGDNMGCRVCEDSGHGAQQCHHNALILARNWVRATRIWQCWHCDFIATNEAEANEHFGLTDEERPACVKTLLVEAEELRDRQKDLALQIDGALMDNDRLRGLVLRAAGWFGEYADHHKARIPHDSTAADKYERNKARAEALWDAAVGDGRGDPVMSRFAHDVLAERTRQRVVEGFDADHDDKVNGQGELLDASLSYGYAALEEAPLNVSPSLRWPWSVEWWKPTTKRQNLVKAVALSIAEGERLDRAEEKSNAAG